ncbi:hypothetical protein ACFW2Y_18420 [Streptomyces sp. NPDC058877]|uniref:hypothetical protein n=1 Tax=Streptomyces sp. NPDC058877 TaxID=3346665 RepID=UPI0036A34832
MPGAVAVVEVDFEGPDAGRRNAWADAALAALAGDDGPVRCVAGSVRTSTRPWTAPASWSSPRREGASAHAAREAVHAPLDESWQRSFRRPGPVGSRVRRYVPALSLDAGA